MARYIQLYSFIPLQKENKMSIEIATAVQKPLVILLADTSQVMKQSYPGTNFTCTRKEILERALPLLTRQIDFIRIITFAGGKTEEYGETPLQKMQWRGEPFILPALQCVQQFNDKTYGYIQSPLKPKILFVILTSGIISDSSYASQWFLTAETNMFFSVHVMGTNLTLWQNIATRNHQVNLEIGSPNPDVLVSHILKNVQRFSKNN